MIAIGERFYKSVRMCTPHKAHRYRTCREYVFIGRTISSEGMSIYDPLNLRSSTSSCQFAGSVAATNRLAMGKSRKAIAIFVNEDGSTRIDQTALGIANSA